MKNVYMESEKEMEKKSICYEFSLLLRAICLLQFFILLEAKWACIEHFMYLER